MCMFKKIALMEEVADLQGKEECLEVAFKHAAKILDEELLTLMES